MKYALFWCSGQKFTLPRVQTFSNNRAIFLSIRVICITVFGSPTYRVPSAFQLTLYGFCSKSLIFCLSMETGCAPGNPDLKRRILYYYYGWYNTKQYMSETNLTWVSYLLLCSPYDEITVNWNNTSFHKNANKRLSFSWQNESSQDSNHHCCNYWVNF